MQACFQNFYSEIRLLTVAAESCTIDKRPYFAKSAKKRKGIHKDVHEWKVLAGETLRASVLEWNAINVRYTYK